VHVSMKTSVALQAQFVIELTCSQTHDEQVEHGIPHPHGS